MTLRHSVFSIRRPVFARAVGLAIVGVLLAAAGATADPSIKTKQEQAQAILEEVRELDAAVGDAAERWNGANYELGKITADLTDTRKTLTRARSGVTVAQSRLAKHLRAMYVQGAPPSAIEVILGAQSLTELIDMIETRNRVGSQDAQIVNELRALRAHVTTSERKLSKAQDEQKTLVSRLASERTAIESRLTDRKRLLASVQAEVQQLQAQERERQADLRRQASLRLAQQQAAAATQRQIADVADTTSGSSAPAFDESSDFTPPPADASKGAQVVAIAMQYLGIDYVWGAADPSVGFDCSGLTMYVFNHVGVSLPHYAAAQYGLGVPVSRDQLEPGDLVFFHGLGHMGMYIGGGNMIHAPHTGDVVKISSIYDGYYASSWVGARRVL